MHWLADLKRRQKETALVFKILKYFCMISQIIGLILDERKFIKVCQYISNLYLSLNLSKHTNYSNLIQFLSSPPRILVKSLSMETGIVWRNIYTKKY